MHFPARISENGTKNIIRDKQTIKKVPLMFLDVKAFTVR